MQRVKKKKKTKNPFSKSDESRVSSPDRKISILLPSAEEKRVLIAAELLLFFPDIFFSVALQSHRRSLLSIIQNSPIRFFCQSFALRCNPVANGRSQHLFQHD